MGNVATTFITVVEPGPAVVFRMNLGGGAYTDTQGKNWSPDQQYLPGSFGWVPHNSSKLEATSNPIANTVEDPLFQVMRQKIDAVRFDVPNGDYQVRLLFAEILGFLDTPGERIFDVSIEGNLVLDDLDVFVSSGGLYSAMERTFPVTVTDGRLDVDLSQEVYSAFVSAVEVLSTSP